MMLADQDIARLCRGMALMLHGGIGLGDGLLLLAREEDKSLAQPLEAAAARLDRGDLLSDTLQGSGLFPDYAVALVRVGEGAGRVEEALDSLAVHYARQHSLTLRLRSAVAYPAMLSVLMLTVVGVLLVQVLPVFDRVYASLGSRMTGAGAGLLYLGQLLKRSLPILAVGLAAAVGLGVACRLRPEWGRRLAAEGIRRFGDRGVLRLLYNARFLRGFSMGISSGFSPEEAARFAADTLPGWIRRRESCARALAGGASLGDALAEGGFLSPARSRFLNLAQRGGSADAVLADMARELEQESAEALEEAAAKVEPAMVLVCAALVGLILLAVMLPLAQILLALG